MTRSRTFVKNLRIMFYHTRCVKGKIFYGHPYVCRGLHVFCVTFQCVVLECPNSDTSSYFLFKYKKNVKYYLCILIISSVFFSFFSLFFFSFTTFSLARCDVIEPVTRGTLHALKSFRCRTWHLSRRPEHECRNGRQTGKDPDPYHDRYVMHEVVTHELPDGR